MENENTFDAQLVESGSPKIVKIPFQQDKRFGMNEVYPDAVIFDAEAPKKFKLDSSYLDYKDLQPYESYIMYDLRCVDFVEQQQIYDLEPEEMRAAFRRFVRKAYPVYVDLVPGVLYSPSKGIVIESFGKIPHLLQQEINPHLLFKNYKAPSERVTRVRKALQEVGNLEIMETEENSQNIADLVDSQSSPLRDPRSLCSASSTVRRRALSVLGHNISERNRQATLHSEEMFPPLLTRSEESPNAIPPSQSCAPNAPMRKRSYSEALGSDPDERRKRIAGCSRELFPPFNRESPERPSSLPIIDKGQPFRENNMQHADAWGSFPSSSSRNQYTDAARNLRGFDGESFEEQLKRLNLGNREKFQKCLAFEFFDFDKFEIRHDKKQTLDLENIPSEPLGKSLHNVAWNFKADRNLERLATVGVAPAVYGDNYAYINLVKFVNTYSAHCVNFSVRESQKVIFAILRALCKALQLQSEKLYDKAKREVSRLRKDGRYEEAAAAERKADELYQLRLLEIGERVSLLEQLEQ